MLNHFPVTLVLLIPPICLAGIFFRRGSILAVAFSLCLLVGLATPLVAKTGHLASERFNLTSIQPPLDERGDIAMEMHQDMAEKAGPLLYLVAVAGVVGLLLLRFRPAWQNHAAIAVILFSAGAALFTLQSALLGGQIRHPEFRPKTDLNPTHACND